jgi:hypothetical protein
LVLTSHCAIMTPRRVRAARTPSLLGSRRNGGQSDTLINGDSRHVGPNSRSHRARAAAAALGVAGEPNRKLQSWIHFG